MAETPKLKVYTKPNDALLHIEITPPTATTVSLNMADEGKLMGILAYHLAGSKRQSTGIDATEFVSERRE